MAKHELFEYKRDLSVVANMPMYVPKNVMAHEVGIQEGVDRMMPILESIIHEADEQISARDSVIEDLMEILDHKDLKMEHLYMIIGGLGVLCCGAMLNNIIRSRRNLKLKREIEYLTDQTKGSDVSPAVQSTYIKMIQDRLSKIK